MQNRCWFSIPSRHVLARGSFTYGDAQFAEGAGRWSDADCAKHYEIARGEAMEYAASLDVLKLRRLLAAERSDNSVRLLERIVAMLAKII